MFSERLTFNHEFSTKIRAGLVGCGGQAFRNILPAFHFAPVELVALADVCVDRAHAYAKQFGAGRVYQDYRLMLEHEQLDAVFFATGYDESWRPLYPAQAADAMRAGCHAWIEKPPADSVSAIEELRNISRECGRQVGVGFMKMFSPATAKVRAILKQPEFGKPTTLYLRDPEKLPPAHLRGDPEHMHYFLDHIVHPMSVIHSLMGPLRRMYLEEGPDGEPIFAMKFSSGAAGVLHMPWGMSGTSPMERLEIVGQGANVIVENNIRLTYYRPGHRGLGRYEYGRIGDFTSSDADAPLHWEMDCYSGQPYNMHLFSQGYAQEILYFCQCILNVEPIRIGGLDDAWHIVRFFEACQRAGRQPIEFSD